MSQENDIDRIFEKLKDNYHRQRALAWGLRGLILSLTVIIIWLLINRFTELWIDGSYLMYVFISIPVVSYFCGHIWPVSLKTIVRRADRKVNFEERLITLYEYLENKSDNPFLKFLKEDISGIFTLLQERKIFPQKWMPEAGIVVPLIIILSIFIFWGGESPLAPAIRHPFPGPPDMEQHTSELFDDKATDENDEDEDTAEEDEELTVDKPEKISSDTERTEEQLSDVQEDEEQMDRQQSGTQEENKLEDRLDESGESDDMEQQQQSQQGDSSEGKAGTTSPSESSEERQMAEQQEDKETPEKNETSKQSNEDTEKESKAAVDSEQHDETKEEDVQDETEEKDVQDEDGQQPSSEGDSSQEIANKEQQTDEDSEERDETEDIEDTASSDSTSPEEEIAAENDTVREEQSSQQEQKMDDTEGADERGQSGAGAEPGTPVQQEEGMDVTESAEDSNYYLNRVESQLNNNKYLSEYLEEMIQPEQGASEEISQERLIEYREELLNEFTNEEIPVMYRDLIKEYFQRITEPAE